MCFQIILLSSLLEIGFIGKTSKKIYSKTVGLGGLEKPSQTLAANPTKMDTVLTFTMKQRELLLWIAAALYLACTPVRLHHCS
jgi:hypothetical protein